MNRALLEKIAAYAEAVFSKNLPEHIYYHDIVHTKNVVHHAVAIGGLSNISEHDMFLVESAAWFHDLGYTKKTEGHEEVSIEMALDFLQKEDVSAADCELIKNMIGATRYDTTPLTLLEKILVDADVAHLGSPEYFEMSKALRKEWESLKGERMSKAEWLGLNIDFFNKQCFYTDAAKSLYEKQKQENLALIMEELEGKKKKNKGPKRSDRGVETMFRVTLKNHIQLSQIADNKANIMLSINAIIISIVLTSLLPKLDKNEYLIWPTVFLLLVCIISVVFATISTIPKVTKTRTDRQSIEDKNANLLFFGNFYKMDYPDFKWGMQRVMEDQDYLYGSMIKDLYYLGIVLYKKYKYLRLCYAVFMVGIILSVIGFLVSMSMTF